MDNGLLDSYDYLITEFTEKVIADRTDWLYGLMKEFIETEQLEDKTFISDDILNHVIIDYYVDIFRLK